MNRSRTMLALLAFMAAAPVMAQIPQTISYQGFVRDQSGQEVTGNVNITVKIYETATGGTAIWSETHNAVRFDKGLFNIILGEAQPTPSPLNLAFDKTYYIGLTIGAGGNELSPRTELASSPYALNARKVVDSAIVTNSIANGAVTNPKIADGTITAGKIKSGEVVTSINGLHDKVVLKAGANIAITSSNDSIMIAGTGSGAGNISRISVGPGLTGGGDSGNVIVRIGTESILNTMLGYHSVTEAKIDDNSIITRTIADAAVTLSKLNIGGALVGQAISYFGGGVPVWGYPYASQLIVPFSQTANTTPTMFALTNTGTGSVATFTINNAASSSNAMIGTTNGTGSGVQGVHSASTGTAAGVRGETNSQDANSAGVIGIINSTTPGGFSAGVRGTNNGTGGLGIGVYGSQAGSGWGVYGTTPSGIGVHGNSTTGFGLYGLSTSGTAVYGLSTNGESGRFENTNNANSSNTLTASTNGTGNAFIAANSGTSGNAGNFTINNAANASNAVNVTTNGTGAAVNAVNTGTGIGGSFAINNATNAANALNVTTNGTGNGASVVIGNATNANNAVTANTNGTGRAGLFTVTNAANTTNALEVTTTGTGRAVLGRRGAGSGVSLGQTEAIRGDNTDGPGLAGTANTAVGVYGTSVTTHGIWGVGTVANAAGVEGRNDVVNGFGVEGVSLGGGIGVHGTSQTGNASQFDITNAASTADAVRATQNGLGRGVYSTINNASNIVAAVRGETNGGGYGIFGQATGNGNAGFFQVSNPASTSSTVNVTTNGIGSGITVQLTNASNGARGIDVLQAGVGPGVFATSAGGNAVWGITSSISAAGVIGDNTFGEAVVGRNRGGNGVGAVVGRNDSSGYGVRGFNTKDGIGVLGQAGISGGTGVGGRFENVNAANGNDAIQGATNGTGWAANLTNANNSSASRALRVSTTAGQGGNAVTVANGTVAMSYQHPYASNTVVDDAYLVVTTAGNVTIPTGPPLVDGATVWLVNNSGAVVTLTNTTVGAFNVNPGRAIQLLFISTVSGANWIPVQP
ncbi:MAG: hypothetical protein JWQ98_2427 [Chlorobi bacterium]|nr:hypothetical protein [Chlorobiota bacterium]